MNQRPKQPELIPVSLVWSIPRSILLLPLGWDASPSQGHPSAVCCRYPFIHWVKTTRRTKLELQTSRSGVWSVDLLATRASFMMILSVKTSNVTNNPTQKYTFVYDHGTCLCCTGQLPVTIMYIQCGKYCSAFWQLCYLLRICVISSKLCSSNAWWPIAPNFCYWATRKNFFCIEIMCWAPWISEHWGPFNRPFYSCAWKRGWGWPSFDTNLSALWCKSSYSYANYYFSRTISIRKQRRFVSKQGDPQPRFHP